MSVIWIFFIITSVVALPSEIDNHRHPLKTDQQSNFDNDMEKIVTKLPKNMRKEILGEVPDEDVGYFDVLGKSPDGKPTYIIGNKDNKKFRVKIKPKSKKISKSEYVSTKARTEIKTLKDSTDHSKQSSENYEHLNSNSYIIAPHVNYNKTYKRTKGRYSTSKSKGHIDKLKLRDSDSDFDLHKLFDSESFDNDLSDLKDRIKTRQGPQKISYIKKWKEIKSHPQDDPIYKDKGKKHHYTFKESHEEHHVIIPHKNDYDIEHESVEFNAKKTKKKKKNEFAISESEEKYNHFNSDNKQTNNKSKQKKKNEFAISESEENYDYLNSDDKQTKNNKKRPSLDNNKSNKNKYNVNQAFIDDSKDQSEEANKNQAISDIEHQLVKTYLNHKDNVDGNKNGFNEPKFDVNSNKDNYEDYSVILNPKNFTSLSDFQPSNILNPGQDILENVKTGTNTDKNVARDGGNNSEDASDDIDFLDYGPEQSLDKQIVPDSKYLDDSIEDQKKNRGGDRYIENVVHGEDNDNLKGFDKNIQDDNIHGKVNYFDQYNDARIEPSNDNVDNQDFDPFEYSSDSPKMNENKVQETTESIIQDIFPKIEGNGSMTEMVKICKDLKLKPQDIWLLANKYFDLDIRDPKDFKKFKTIYDGFISNLRNGTEAEYLKSVSKLIKPGPIEWDELAEKRPGPIEWDEIAKEIQGPIEWDEYSQGKKVNVPREGPVRNNDAGIAQDIPGPIEWDELDKGIQGPIEWDESAKERPGPIKWDENSQGKKVNVPREGPVRNDDAGLAQDIPGPIEWDESAKERPGPIEWDENSQEKANDDVVKLPFKPNDSETSLETTTEIESWALNPEQKNSNQPYGLRDSDERVNDDLNGNIPKEPIETNLFMPKVTINEPIKEKNNSNHNLKIFDPDLDLPTEIPSTIEENVDPEINTSGEDEPNNDEPIDNDNQKYPEDISKEIDKDTPLSDPDLSLAEDSTESETSEDADQPKQIELNDPTSDKNDAFQNDDDDDPKSHLQENLESTEISIPVDAEKPAFDDSYLQDSVETPTEAEVLEPFVENPEHFKENPQEELNDAILEPSDVFEAPEYLPDILRAPEENPQKNNKNSSKDEVFDEIVKQPQDDYEVNGKYPQEDFTPVEKEPSEAPSKPSLENLETPEKYPQKDESPLTGKVTKEQAKYPYEVEEAPQKQLQYNLFQNFAPYKLQPQDSKTPKQYFRTFHVTPAKHLPKVFAVKGQPQPLQDFNAIPALHPLADADYKVNVKKPVVHYREVIRTQKPLQYNFKIFGEQYPELFKIPDKPIGRPKKSQKVIAVPLKDEGFKKNDNFPYNIYEALLKDSKAKIKPPKGTPAKLSDFYSNALPVPLVPEALRSPPNVKPFITETKDPHPYFYFKNDLDSPKYYYRKPINDFEPIPPKKKKPSRNGAKEIHITIERGRGDRGDRGKLKPHVKQSDRVPSLEPYHSLLLDELQPDFTFEAPNFKGNDDKQQAIALVEKTINFIITSEFPKLKELGELLLFKVLDENGLFIEPIYKKVSSNDKGIYDNNLVMGDDAGLILTGIKIKEMSPQKNLHKQHDLFDSNILPNNGVIQDIKHKPSDLDYSQNILLDDNDINNIKIEKPKRAEKISNIWYYLDDGLSDDMKRKLVLRLLEEAKDRAKENMNTINGPTNAPLIEQNETPSSVLLQILLPKYASDVKVKHEISILPPVLRNQVNKLIISPTPVKLNKYLIDAIHNAYLVDTYGDNLENKGEKPILNVLGDFDGNNNYKKDNDNLRDSSNDLLNKIRKEIQDRLAKNNNKLKDSPKLLFDTDYKTPKSNYLPEKLGDENQMIIKPPKTNMFLHVNKIKNNDHQDPARQKPAKTGNNIYFPKDSDEFQNSHDSNLRAPESSIKAFYKLRYIPNKDWDPEDNLLSLQDFPLLPDNWPIPPDNSKAKLTPEIVLRLKIPNLQRLYNYITMDLLKDALHRVEQYLLMYKIPFPKVYKILQQIEAEMMQNVENSAGKCLLERYEMFLNYLKQSVKIHALSKTKPYVGNNALKQRNLKDINVSIKL